MTSKESRGINGRRLLVVENEYLIAADLASWLESQGVEVLGPVPSVEDALDLIDAVALPDAAVLDINLGEEQVFPVADALRSAKVPFIFLSGYDPKIIPENYRNALRCAKPLDRSELLRTLVAVLDG